MAEVADETRAEVKRRDKVLYYHDLGLNNVEIGKLLDCSKENVRQILERCGLYSNVCWNMNRSKDES